MVDVIDLLFDFEICPYIKKYYRLVQIYSRIAEFTEAMNHHPEEKTFPLCKWERPPSDARCVLIVPVARHGAKAWMRGSSWCFLSQSVFHSFPLLSFSHHPLERRGEEASGKARLKFPIITELVSPNNLRFCKVTFTSLRLPLIEFVTVNQVILWTWFGPFHRE